MSLFWRVFVTNAALLVVAALVLGLTPATISAPLALTEAVVLGLGLTGTLVANLLLLRPSFAPLERLARRMREVDPLRPAARIEATGTPEVVMLVETFNDMLARLARERRERGRRALLAQEGERRRIATELHDEVGQTMTGVLLLLKRLSADVPPAQRATVREAEEAVRAGLHEVRRIARELRPEMLEELGLVAALTELAESFARRSGIRVERSLARELPPLEPEAELAIYRVAQEGLTNVARHADATTAWVVLEHLPGRLVLTVEDDGRGFEDGGRRDGGGLRGMRDRALAAGGVVAVEPRPGGGVALRLEVPADGAGT